MKISWRIHKGIFLLPLLMLVSLEAFAEGKGGLGIGVAKNCYDSYGWFVGWQCKKAACKAARFQAARLCAEGGFANYKIINTKPWFPKKYSDRSKVDSVCEVVYVCKS